MKLTRTLFVARRELPRVLPLMRDLRVPLWSKLAAAGAAVFIVSPLNVFGDIPLLGVVDDAALLMVLAHVFVGFGERRTTPGHAMKYAVVPPRRA